MTDDLIVQCDDTQQVMTLSLSQMYETLASSGYASMSQQSLAEAQVRAINLNAAQQPNDAIHAFSGDSGQCTGISFASE
jgi:hypothetical protein